VALRNRLKRLIREAEGDAVLVGQRDGTVRVFDAMDAYAGMFLASMDLYRKDSVTNDVLEAVRNAAPESRAAFEERFGPIEMTGYVVASPEDGGWVRVYELGEDGSVEVTLHPGDSAEAAKIRADAKRGTEPWT
jgi:hypothetical protein